MNEEQRELLTRVFDEWGTDLELVIEERCIGNEGDEARKHYNELMEETFKAFEKEG